MNNPYQFDNDQAVFTALRNDFRAGGNIINEAVSIDACDNFTEVILGLSEVCRQLDSAGCSEVSKKYKVRMADFITATLVRYGEIVFISEDKHVGKDYDFDADGIEL